MTQLLTTETVRAHVAQSLGGAWSDASGLVAEERSDGMVNQVFLVRNATDAVIVKQGLPYVRIARDWPMSPQRTIREADFYATWSTVAEGSVPALHHLDRDRFILTMEFLDGCEIWRDALIAGRLHESAAGDLGALIGRTACATSRMGLSSAEWATQVARSANPDMERLMEDVLFLQPWGEHPRNAVTDDIVDIVEECRSSVRFRARVEEAHRAFLMRPEVLAHGDLHTGSVMVSDTKRPRVFDGEFARCAPAGFDLGLLWGNLVIAAAAAAASGRIDAVDAILRMVQSSWDGYRSALLETVPDEAQIDVAGWLRQIEVDAQLYAGIELGRRMIGLGKPEDIEDLAPAQRARARGAVMIESWNWVCEPADLTRALEKTRSRLARQ